MRKPKVKEKPESNVCKVHFRFLRTGTRDRITEQSHCRLCARDLPSPQGPQRFPTTPAGRQRQISKVSAPFS